MKTESRQDRQEAHFEALIQKKALLFRRARRLASLLTQWDEKQSKKRGWNPHGLALYFQALESWEADTLSATDPIRALADYFTHNPADKADFCLAPVRQFVREIQAGKL